MQTTISATAVKSETKKKIERQGQCNESLEEFYWLTVKYFHALTELQIS